MNPSPHTLPGDAAQYAAAAGLDPARLPTHVAVIMDGNGRWAESRGLNRLTGHNQGYRTLKNIVMESQKLGLKCLTVYGFSTENWRRSEEEVNGLMRLMLRAMRSEIEELIQSHIRVRISGRIDSLPPDLQEEFARAEQRTAHFSGLTFNLAINYGGRAEVVDAVRLLTQQVKEGVLRAEEIDEQTIARCLYAPDLPDPDLLIRTSGELRLSNFLLWETAYSEIYVTPIYWPDFGPEQFVAALADYQRRKRRFGAVEELD